MKQRTIKQTKDLKRAPSSLYQAFLALKKPDEVRQFLSDLCTPAELEAMVDRWWIVTLLDEGHSYRDINSKTGISVTTIGRVARHLNMGAGGYSIPLNRKKSSKQL